MMTIDNQGVTAEKDEETSLCDMCANAAECYNSNMVVDACSSYWPKESEGAK